MSKLSLLAGAALVAACGGSSFTLAPDTGDGGKTSGSKEGGSGGSATSSSSGTTSTSGATSSGQTGTSSGVASSSSSGTSSTSSSSSGKSSSTSSSGGSGDGGSPTGPCPSTPPTAGGACAPNSLACEFGYSSVPECDTVATCTNGAWAVTKGNGTSCTQGATCPANSPTDGASCTTAEVCDYPPVTSQTIQTRCACVAGTLVTRWHCQSPATPCPLPRPRLGSACTSTSTAACDYGAACTIPGYSEQQCEGGVWTIAAPVCPG